MVTSFMFSFLIIVYSFFSFYVYYSLTYLISTMLQNSKPSDVSYIFGDINLFQWNFKQTTQHSGSITNQACITWPVLICSIVIFVTINSELSST